jgi:hypothetical protein
MDKSTKNMLDVTVKLYRAASGDEESTTEEIIAKFASEPITAPLAHHSRISGKVPSYGSILSGRFPQKSVEEILAEPQQKGKDVLNRRNSREN